PAAAVARRPALHERLRADVGRRAGNGESGIGNRKSTVAPAAGAPALLASPRRFRPCTYSIDSRFQIPHSRYSIMNRKGDKALIVGLDIGTSKVVALVGEYSPGNPIEVIGIGSHESRGLKRGVVVD